jgi:hypothetical protein
VTWGTLDRLLGAGFVGRVVIAGEVGLGRRSLAARLAAVHARPLLVLDLAGLDGPDVELALRLAARDALLHEALLAIDIDDGVPGPAVNDVGLWQRAIDELVLRHPEPLFILTRGEAPPLRGTPGSVVHVRLRPLSPQEQVAHLARALVLLDAEVPPEPLLLSTVCRSNVTPAALAYAARVGVANARMERLGRPLPSASDLEVAVAEYLEETTLPPPQSPPDVGLGTLPVSLETMEQLLELLNQLRAGTPDRGPTVALFSGPPAIAKSRAGAALASELGLEMVRVDLWTATARSSALVDAAFTAAVESRALLAIDGVEALWDPRVGDASGSAGGTLLDWLDRFPGVVLLAMAPGAQVDAGLWRRIRHVVAFAP